MEFLQKKKCGIDDEPWLDHNNPLNDDGGDGNDEADGNGNNDDDTILLFSIFFRLKFMLFSFATFERTFCRCFVYLLVCLIVSTFVSFCLVMPLLICSSCCIVQKIIKFLLDVGKLEIHSKIIRTSIKKKSFKKGKYTKKK